jgi:SAM-dependent methyltransferase
VNGIVWTCPRCRGGLDAGERRWSCRGCGAEFRALRGVPDLRTGDDLYLANDDDWEFALRLDAEFDRLDFHGLLELYFDLSPDVPPALKQRQVTHILTAPGRAGRWLERLGDGRRGPVLDLGCGTGSFLAAVGRVYPNLAGVDIAMRWLLVAKKRLNEEGLSSVPLACACAEGLPLKDASVGGVVAGDVIEHVADQRETLAEAYRVLEPGGRLVMASPNRYSLAPEPHVQVWGVGFLPRRWMGPYVQLVRKIDFRAIRTLGYAEWARVLGVSPFGGGEVVVPPLPSDDLAHFSPFKRWVGRAYNAAVTTGPGRRLARAFGPLFHVVCEKPGDGPGGGPHSPSRATRRRSRPSTRRA